MTKRLICILIFFVNILMVFQVNGVIIQLYRHPNFNGLLWQSNSTEGCENIPRSQNANVYSIKTDTCFIAYNQPDCGYRLSMKYSPGNFDLSSNQLGRNGYIQSFHTCNEVEGGSQLNVDITRYFGYMATSTPDVLESYTNVCSCVNIPQYVQKMDQWSIHNHYNTMFAYYQPDCSVDKWEPKFIAAERWTDSNDMYAHNKLNSRTNVTYKIQSFGPDPNSSYFQASCNSSHVRVTTENWELTGKQNLNDDGNGSSAESVTIKGLWSLMQNSLFYYTIVVLFN